MDEFRFFSNDKNDWNYNLLIDNPNINPYTNRPFKDGSYDPMKINCLIMLKEIMKQSNNIFHEDLLEWIEKKTGQGSKSDFYDILSITGNLFNYVLTCNDPINYKKFRVWCLHNKIYYNSFKEKELCEFEGGDDYERERNREEHDLNKTYNNLFLKVTAIYLNSNDPNDLIKSKNFLIILEYLKKRIWYKSALHKLC
jgi:hypothetical protein